MTHKITIALWILLLSSCDNSPSPDLSEIPGKDILYYTQLFETCDGEKYNCDCLAKATLNHRNSSYRQYTLDYNTIQKPRLEKTVADLQTKLEQNIFQASDVRVIDAIKLELDYAKNDLDRGITSLDSYELAPLNKKLLDLCSVK